MCVIYFNYPTYLDPAEIHLPLPADDAAFDASNALQCAQALGLKGETAANEVNASGTRNARQSELSTTLAVLQQSNAPNLAPGSTNSFSKFILVHALIVQIHHIRRSMLIEQGAQTSDTARAPAIINAISHGGLSAQQFLRNIIGAMNKWWAAWRRDYALQYPSTAPRLTGFCRDAEPFFFIAKLMLQSSPKDLTEAPDVRCPHIMRVLKLVKSRLAAETRSRSGESKSEAIGTSDDYFAMDDLSWDMKLLFAPLASPGSIGKVETLFGQESWLGDIRV